MIINFLSIILFIVLYLLLFYLFFKIIETIKILNFKSYNTFTPFDKDKDIRDVFFLDNSKKIKNPFQLDRYNIPLSLPISIIYKGEIYYENLNKIKKDYNWLINILNKRGLNTHLNVYKAILNESGKLILLNAPDMKNTKA